MPTPFSATDPATRSSNGFHPSHISKSAIAALTLPLAPSAIWRVIDGSAPAPGEEDREKLVFRWLEAD